MTKVDAGLPAEADAGARCRGGRHRHRHPGRQHEPPEEPLLGPFAINDGGRRRPAALKTGTSNDARDLNAYGYIGAPNKGERADGEYALAVGAWNGNSDNSLVSTPSAPLFSIDVTTHVWEHFLQEATKGWSINPFAAP